MNWYGITYSIRGPQIVPVMLDADEKALAEKKADNPVLLHLKLALFSFDEAKSLVEEYYKQRAEAVSNLKEEELLKELELDGKKKILANA